MSFPQYQSQQGLVMQPNMMQMQGYAQSMGMQPQFMPQPQMPQPQILRPVPVSTGAVVSAQKKPADPSVPTKVLYVRNLPDSYTEADVQKACDPFGMVTNIYIQKDKRHGFIEFADLNQATSCFNHFRQQPWSSLGRTIEFHWSGRNGVEKKHDVDLNPPNKVLLVTVSNVVYPITIDVLSQVFTSYGGIHKVIIFQRQQGVQALVQLFDLNQAINAKNSLDGQNIYAGCNSLKVQYSSMETLSIKANCDRSWDFTAPVVGNQAVQKGHLLGQGGAISAGMQFMSPAGVAGMMGQDINANMMGGMSTVLMVRGLDAAMTKPDELAALFAVYGNVERVKIMFHKRDQALVQLDNPQHAMAAKQHLHGVTLHGKRVAVDLSKGGPIPKPMPKPGEETLTKDFLDPAYHRYKQTVLQAKPYKAFPPCQYLHLSNMPGGTSEADIRSLLEPYGNVVAIKFLQPTGFMAVVTMEGVDNAVEALVGLHHKDFKSRPLRVGFASFGASK